ncbi:TPA: SEC10/PgrA surface exclusion domain-containing protein [Streptococcus suis]|nr:SEC10/PgrA surface exclusion domain-containing protein [Streptococcus suis]
MKKLTVLGALATAVVSTGRQVVHAEEVVEENAVSPVAEASTTTQSTVTEADVTSAKTELDTAQNAVSSQETVVSTAQSDVATAKEEVTQAQTQLVDASALAEEATPENIASAKESVTTAETTVSTATQTLEAKKEAVTQAEAKVSTQETVVSATQSDVATKTQAVTDAQSDVATAQAILDGTGQAEVIAQAEKASQQLATDKQALSTAQTELVSAQKADSTRLSTIAQAEQTVSTATQDVASKTALVTEATAKATETASALQVAQDAFKVAENDLNAINTITLSPEYMSALRDYALNYAEKGAEATAILKALSPSLKASNQFKANANDSQTAYNVNELPLEVRQELSLFASDLINQIRTAFGTPLTKVTPSALELADLTTDGYVANNWSWSDVVAIGHDAKAVNQAAATFGLPTTNATQEAKGMQYYENMNSYGQELTTITLSDAKSRVYRSIVEFMFNSYEWLHAEAIAGLKTTETGYLGVDISSRTGVTGIHFLEVSSKDASGTSFDQTEIVNPVTASTIEANYQSAQATLNQATTTNNEAQAIKTQAIQNQALSQSRLDQAQTDLATAQAVPVLTPQAQAKVSALEETVRLSTLANDKAQEALANLQADVKVKQANLETAKQVLAQKQAILDGAKKQLASEQATLSQLEQAVTTAQSEVVSAQKELATAQSNLVSARTFVARLEEAPALLEQAKLRLLNAVTSLQGKEEVLANELEKLAELKEEEAEASAYYQAVLSAYQSILEAKRQEELARQYEEIVRAGGNPIPVVDASGRITSYVQEVPKQATPIVSTTSSNTVISKAETSKAVLPNTGERSSSIALFGIALVGLGFLSRKKREE